MSKNFHLLIVLLCSISFVAVAQPDMWHNKGGFVVLQAGDTVFVDAINYGLAANIITTRQQALTKVYGAVQVKSFTYLDTKRNIYRTIRGHSVCCPNQLQTPVAF